MKKVSEAAMGPSVSAVVAGRLEHVHSVLLVEVGHWAQSVQMRKRSRMTECLRFPRQVGECPR